MSEEQHYRSVRVVLKGRVQGVWFRAWTQQEAEALGLDGWVRNRADGSVEANFAGPNTAVEQMLSLCREGPSAARVDDMSVHESAAPSESGFHQLPTA